MSDSKVTVNAGGIGLLGLLIILGLLGVGPCADDCAGCGPTPKSLYEQVTDRTHRENLRRLDAMTESLDAINDKFERGERTCIESP